MLRILRNMTKMTAII